MKEKAMKMVLMTVFAAVVAAASAASSAAPRRVLCWGDSVTEGMAMPRGKDYPAQLQSLLGEGYRVLNSGDGGENSVTIPVRQGAYRIVTADAITFSAGETTVTIGDAFDNGFHTIAGEKIMLTAALGRMIPVNPVEIGNTSYRLSFRDFRWNSPTNRILYACSSPGTPAVRRMRSRSRRERLSSSRRLRKSAVHTARYSSWAATADGTAGSRS